MSHDAASKPRPQALPSWGRGFEAASCDMSSEKVSRLTKVPSFSMLHVATLKSWEGPGDEASSFIHAQCTYIVILYTTSTIAKSRDSRAK